MTQLTQQITKQEAKNTRFTLKEPGSALTHAIGVLFALVAAPVLLLRSYRVHGTAQLLPLLLFSAGILLLYLASTLYHSLSLPPKGTLLLKKLDHIMIYALIVGSYAPICLIALAPMNGSLLLLAVAACAVLGLLQCCFFVNCPKWVSTCIYIAMGWLCLFSLKPLLTCLPLPALLWLLAGGFLYTVGGIIYALKLPRFNSRHPQFGTHEIFHLFCLGGTLCHYIVVSAYLV